MAQAAEHEQERVEALTSGQDEAVPDAPSPPSTRSSARRLVALACLLVPLVATLVILAEGRSGSVDAAAPGIQEAVRPAWSATGELSAALTALKKGESRATAIRAARKADDAVKASRKKLAALDVPASQGDVFALVQSALRSQSAWVSAVGSTLLNPASPRREDLAELAKSAMRRSAAAERFDVAEGPAVRGTGKLLSATKRS